MSTKVIVIDLEMNNPQTTKTIIELGYVIGDPIKNQIFVQNSIYVDCGEVLQDEIVKLCHIDLDEYEKNKLTLIEAYETMVVDIERFNPTRTCVQWGIGDSRLLKSQLNLSWEQYIFRDRTFDVKSLYQMYKLFKKESVIGGLAKASNELLGSFEGNQHRAGVDAYNTFRCFSALGKKLSLSDKIQDLITLKGTN